MAKEVKKEEVGITVKKDSDISEWYTQVIQKAELAEYTDVGGCIIFRPRAYAVWEKVQQFFDAEIKKLGVKNAYFPLLIPESLLKKEAKHVAGFAPEVAWVTEGGHSKLSERLAIRPTSETIMYDAYSKWIKSHRDLPLLINQWCNIVRWEFKHAVPFLRTREFLWQEGHTVHATKESADKEVRTILDLYAKVMEDLYAIPVIKGKKTDSEKFAGADYTLSIETFMPSGKSIQVATSHGLGQNFSKSFDIKFLDKDEKTKFAWQNSWGISTRTIGIMIMIHGDDKGLVLPPKVAPTHIAIVPIIFEKDKEKVLKAARDIEKSLSKEFSVELDDRESYSPGWKFSDHEMKGVPIRIEIGPRDLANDSAVIVRRDNGEKINIKIKDINKKIKETLDDIQRNLYNKAKKFIDSSLVNVNSMDDLKKAIENKKFALVSWCGKESCETKINEKTGAKSMNMPLDQPKRLNKCISCDDSGKFAVYFAKSY